MNQIIIVLGLVSLGLFQSLEKDNGNNGIDKIEIISISPSTDLEDGVEYNFVVDIEYTLATAKSGVLTIGFNTESAESHSMIYNVEEIIEKGSGSHTFNVSTIAKDWGNEDDFKVNVNISKNPHPSNWTPLAYDFMPLYFMD